MHNEVMKNIIKEIRNYKKLSQKEFGQLIGKKEITIRKYEKGDIKISFDIFRHILKTFNLDFIEIDKIIISCIEKYLNGRESTKEEEVNFITPLFEVLFEVENINFPEKFDISFFSNEILTPKNFTKKFKKNIDEYISSIIFNNLKDTSFSICTNNPEYQKVYGFIIEYINYFVEYKIMKNKDILNIIDKTQK